MTDARFDELLYRALGDAAMEEAAEGLAWLREHPEEHSPWYRREMERLLRDPFGYARRKGKGGWRKAARCALAAALTAAVLVGGAFALSPALREKVVQWVTQIYEEFIAFDFVGPAEGAYTAETMPTDIRPGYIPEGYEEVWSVAYGGAVSVVYENEEGNRLFFDYAIIGNGQRLLSTNSQYHVVDEINYGMTRIKVFESKNMEEKSSFLVWVGEENGLVFQVGGKVDLSYLLLMMESLQDDF